MLTTFRVAFVKDANMNVREPLFKAVAPRNVRFFDFPLRKVKRGRRAARCVRHEDDLLRCLELNHDIDRIQQHSSQKFAHRRSFPFLVELLRTKVWEENAAG